MIAPSAVLALRAALNERCARCREEATVTVADHEGNEQENATPNTEHASPWSAAFPMLREWDPAWAQSCAEMAMNPWNTGVLGR